MLQKNLKLLENARKLRREMTKQEKHLWYDFLRTYEYKVYKQRIIGNYIVDFYCSKAKLAIELDGSQHYTDEGKEYDDVRTGFLNENGITVLRFPNSEIDKNFSSVCDFIDMKIKELTK